MKEGQYFILCDAGGGTVVRPPTSVLFLLRQAKHGL
jgi:hypothetical protein